MQCISSSIQDGWGSNTSFGAWKGHSTVTVFFAVGVRADLVGHRSPTLKYKLSLRTDKGFRIEVALLDLTQHAGEQSLQRTMRQDSTRLSCEELMMLFQ